MIKKLKERYADLLLKNRIGCNLYHLNDTNIYIMKTNDNVERDILFSFWKYLGLEITGNSNDSYLTEQLIDTRINSNKDICVRYESYDRFQSNVVRAAHSHSYFEFKEMIKTDKELYEVFINIEATCIQNFLHKLFRILEKQEPRERLFIICCEDLIEENELYSFWKKIGITPKEDEYQSFKLCDIDLSDNKIKVSYALWHLLPANIRRKQKSYPYKFFKELVNKTFPSIE